MPTIDGRKKGFAYGANQLEAGQNPFEEVFSFRMGFGSEDNPFQWKRESSDYSTRKNPKPIQAKPAKKEDDRGMEAFKRQRFYDAPPASLRTSKRRYYPSTGRGGRRWS